MRHDLQSISSTARIGSNVKIGKFCVIDDNVIIEDNVSIENFVMISEGSKISRDTKIGTYTKIGKNVVIGSGCSFTSYCEIRDECRIGNNVSMGSRCTLSAGTIVEDDVILKYSFVYTDTPKLGYDMKKIGVLKRGSKFGANVTIMPGVTVGQNAEIGACSLVRHDVPDDEVWYGIPARFFRKALTTLKTAVGRSN